MPEHLVFKVYINDQLIADDEYFLDIDSFYSSVGLQESQIILVGGCGVVDCCGQSRRTFSNPYCWQLGEFHVNWADVYEAARQIVTTVEALNTPGYRYERF